MPGVPSDIHRCVDRMHGKPATPVPNGPKIGVTVGRYPRRMFERLKRVLSGSPPESPQPPAAQEEPGRLDWITEDTPYRFRTWLEDPARRDDAIEILDRQLGAELKTTAIDEPDGRIRLDIVSTFNGGAALLRPLYQLRHHGVLVRDLEVLDSVDDISSGMSSTGLSTPGRFARVTAPSAAGSRRWRARAHCAWRWSPIQAAIGSMAGT